jgi:hypothetical protein
MEEKKQMLPKHKIATGITISLILTAIIKGSYVKKRGAAGSVASSHRNAGRLPGSRGRP